MATALNAGDVLFGRTRQAIFNLTLLRPDESFYLREIARRTGIGVGTVQRELKLLTGSGILRVDAHGYFQANPDAPIFEPLKQLVIRSIGLADVLQRALEPLQTRLSAAFVFGSFARDEPNANSDIDLTLIARDDRLKLDGVLAAFKHAQEQLGREINPFLLTESEWRDKLRSGNSFVCRIRDAKKIFLIGDEVELKRLAQKRVAQEPRRNASGNQRAARAGGARSAERRRKRTR